MRGKRAKALRKLAELKLKEWRQLAPEYQYNVEQHIKIVTQMQDDKPVKVKFISLQAFTRGAKRLYKKYKQDYKNG